MKLFRSNRPADSGLLKHSMTREYPFTHFVAQAPGMFL